MFAAPLRCGNRSRPRSIEPWQQSPRLLELFDETRNRGKCGAKRRTTSGGPAEHVALNHTLDTPRCSIPPRTIHRIQGVAGAADKRDADGSKPDDGYRTARRAIIAA